MKEFRTGILIIGAGPVGCTYARKLYDRGHQICMLDVGPCLSYPVGEHVANQIRGRKSMSAHSVFHEHGRPIFQSVPSQSNVRCAANGDPEINLDGTWALHAVGGMATVWGCVTPRQHPLLERSTLLSAQEWIQLYGQAEDLLRTNCDQFSDSIRGSVVKGALEREYSELKPPYAPAVLPLAAERNVGTGAVVWTGVDTILGSLAQRVGDHEAQFSIRPRHRCRRLVHSNGTVRYAEVEDLTKGDLVRVFAETFVVSSGSILSPQILFNSNIRPEALGCYLTEQPMAIGKIMLRRQLVEEVRAREQSKRSELEQKHDCLGSNRENPLGDPGAHSWIPVSDIHPWHAQLHPYFAPGDQSRIFLLLSWFSCVGQRRQNRVIYSETESDTGGMPRPYCRFILNAAEKERMSEMIVDMRRAAKALGKFVRGAEPHLMPWGTAQHIHGTTRMGKNPKTSVVDVNSRVWNFENLYVSGNGNLPIGHACNPTLTSIANAIKSADSICALDKNEGGRQCSVNECSDCVVAGSAQYPSTRS